MEDPACPFLRTDLVWNGLPLFVEETGAITQVIYHAPAVRLRPPFDGTGGRRSFAASMAVVDPSAAAVGLVCIVDISRRGAADGEAVMGRARPVIFSTTPPLNIRLPRPSAPTLRPDAGVTAPRKPLKAAEERPSATARVITKVEC